MEYIDAIPELFKPRDILRTVLKNSHRLLRLCDTQAFRTVSAMADAGERPPFFPLSAENHSPWVVVTSVVFFCYSVLAVAAKIISRIHINSIVVYDYLIIAATVAAFGETICMVGASRHGLGRFESQISSANLAEYQRVRRFRLLL
jgi:hypothetical protein